ncbi:STAS domain-containing protein [Calothrix sp. PCC 6303]|uniref:STAS domain-containing protein n=1 Tax=Calothrix sp. PCC 6303 TaxID=1170562 RepID=UPI0002A03C16|nr:STAS domain-containing protein [Calothrix sp. PCC 6303]AFZ03007.1 anti-sigma-factor antagonist [Calothrix sp. PCC 6303]
MSTNTKIIQPSGILNAIGGNQLRRDINDCVATGAKIVLVDLQQIDFVDSSGLGALVAAMQIVKSSDGQMFICSLNEQVKMLFELTKMERIFKVFANQEEFKKNFLAIEK